MTAGKQACPSCSASRRRSTRAAGCRCRTRRACASPTRAHRHRAAGRDGADERRQRSGRARATATTASACRSRSRRTCWRSPSATWCSSRSPRAAACGPSRRWSTRAAKEFADTEKMIDATEKLYGPYRWGRYDMLVLPPSFPFGGMENPRLTFVTPTVIVGDKSLVVADRARAGALAGRATWSPTPPGKDVWLNEGFTSYVENRIIEALYGKERARHGERRSAATSWRTRSRTLPERAAGAGAGRALAGSDPDDALTGVAYDKGAWFLQFLEQRFGREVFDPFLRGYFDHTRSRASRQRPVRRLPAQPNLLAKNPGEVTEAELTEWLYEPGIPAFAPQAQSRGFAAVDAARIAWLGSGSAAEPQIDRGLDHAGVGALPRRHAATTLTARAAGAARRRPTSFTGTPNGEIAQRWYPLAVRSGYCRGAPGDGASSCERIGRRKLIMPTYEALVEDAGRPGVRRAGVRQGASRATTRSPPARCEALLAKPRPKPRRRRSDMSRRMQRSHARSSWSRRWAWPLGVVGFAATRAGAGAEASSRASAGWPASKSTQCRSPAIAGPSLEAGQGSRMRRSW